MVYMEPYIKTCLSEHKVYDVYCEKEILNECL